MIQIPHNFPAGKNELDLRRVGDLDRAEHKTGRFEFGRHRGTRADGIIRATRA